MVPAWVTRMLQNTSDLGGAPYNLSDYFPLLWNLVWVTRVLQNTRDLGVHPITCRITSPDCGPSLGDQNVALELKTIVLVPTGPLRPSLEHNWDALKHMILFKYVGPSGGLGD